MVYIFRGGDRTGDMSVHWYAGYGTSGCFRGWNRQRREVGWFDQLPESPLLRGMRMHGHWRLQMQVSVSTAPQWHGLLRASLGSRPVLSQIRLWYVEHVLRIFVLAVITCLELFHQQIFNKIHIFHYTVDLSFLCCTNQRKIVNYKNRLGDGLRK